MILFCAMTILMFSVWLQVMGGEPEEKGITVICEECGGTGRQHFDVSGSGLVDEVAACMYCCGGLVRKDIGG